MKKYRKKPVVIEAVQFWNGNGKNTIAECELFCEGEAYYRRRYEGLMLKTLEGEMLANDGDYIIKGIKGEFYSCKPDIFEQTYEEVEENNLL